MEAFPVRDLASIFLDLKAATRLCVCSTCLCVCVCVCVCVRARVCACVHVAGASYNLSFKYNNTAWMSFDTLLSKVKATGL